MAIHNGIKFPFGISGRGSLNTSTTGDKTSQHIVEGLIQLLGTKYGERVMLPEYGSPLYRLPFELNNEDFMEDITRGVMEAIGIWENRVELQNLAIRVENENTASVEVFFDEIDTGISVKDVIKLGLGGLVV